MKSKINKINDYIAVKATILMSSMWCVYGFLGLAMLPMVWPAVSSAVQYLSSAVIQLVALPLIMVGQAILGMESERRAKKDHEALMVILKEVHALQRPAKKRAPRSEKTEAP